MVPYSIEGMVLKVKGYLNRLGKTGLSLDVDDTLVGTKQFWFEQMMALFGNPENLSLEQMSTQYRYCEKVPYWQTPEALAWIEYHRVNNGVQGKLPLIEERVGEKVREVDGLVPICLYLTNRPRTTRAGTKRWLVSHGFPKALLLTRPDNVSLSQGNAWKAAILTALYPQIRGFVDDNPGVVKMLPKDYPGTVFLYGGAHCSRRDVSIVPCHNWAEVCEKVRQTYPFSCSQPG
jgi:hypothetical protein